MTVCVAVIAGSGAAAIGASDKMISTADNQTKMVKIHHLTESVVAMISGDVALHTELLIELRSVISGAAQTPGLLTVKNLADAYAGAWVQARLRRAERQYLSPLGLSAETFSERAHLLGEKLGGEIARELLGYPMPDTSAIFMGLDGSAGYARAHLYTVENGRLTCHDDTGFASIGVGVYQAASSLMFSGHTAETHLDTAVYLTYAAKKRAEVAPGVGVETDMVYVSTLDPKYFLLGAHVMAKLENLYQEAEKAHRRINGRAESKCHEYLNTLREAPAQPEPEPQIELAGTPPAGAGADGAEIANGGQPAALADVQPVDPSGNSSGSGN